MLKLSNVARKAAFAAVLGTGLIGSGAVMFTPLVAQAQQWHRDTAASSFRGDMDDRYRGDRDDRYRGSYYGRAWDDRIRVGPGVGLYAYPSYYPYYAGYYDPYSYGYGPYCSGYDTYYGYDCSY